MEAFWALLICVLTVWLTKGSSLPVGGSTESSANGPQRRMRDLPPDDFAIKKAVTLHYSRGAMSVRKYKKVTVEANEVNVEASAVHLKVVVASNRSLLADGGLMSKGNGGLMSMGNGSLLADGGLVSKGNGSLLADSGPMMSKGNGSLLADGGLMSKGNGSLLADGGLMSKGNGSLLADGGS